MSEEPDIDYETFCKSRSGRLREWRNALGHQFRDWRRDAIGRFTQKGWTQAEAEVTSCRPIRNKYRSYRTVSPVLSGWAVSFTYTVEGKSYDGILTSKEEVKEHGRFVIKYNPDVPEENDTLETKLDLMDGFVAGAYDIFLLCVLISLAVIGFLLKK